ncbi:protein translocase subunit SecF [bacterium]|nr:protein translocase subunit SecF [bacterium]
MQLFQESNIDFLKKRWVFFVISIVLVLLGMVSLIGKGGANMGIDFRGGTMLELTFANPVSTAKIREILNTHNLPGSEIQDFTKDNRVIIRVKKSKDINIQTSQLIQKALMEGLQDNNFVIDRDEMVGPSVGNYLMKRARGAIFWSFIGIIIYVAFRFKSGVYGMAGVIALIHDVFIVFGVLSLANKEITLTVIAALLALAGYSINDTIVVYDRIRETTRLRRKDTFYDIVNKGINSTLSRTMITSLTTFLVVSSLFFFGGSVIHDFAFTLLFGIIIGTYSSIAIAAPLVYEWETRKGKK